MLAVFILHCLSLNIKLKLVVKFLDPEGRSLTAILVVLVVVGISSLKIP